MALTKDILGGKTLGRALFNEAVREHTRSLSGKVLDLASGSGSYHYLLPKGIELVAGDREAQGARGEIDFNKELPFEEGSVDHVLLFNALYIADDPAALMREIRRVLKPNGTALIASPYLQNEMREPHDYQRFTSEGLIRLFTSTGFSAELHPYGERFSVTANLLHAFWLLSIVRLPVYALARFLDRLIPDSIRANHPAPIGYFCILRRGADTRA